MKAQTAIEWLGWLREGGDWSPVVSAASESECWDLLLRVESGAASVEKLVLPSGKHPEKRRRPK